MPSSQTLSFSGRHGLALVADGYGLPDNPPVVLLHGGGQTRQSWGDTGEQLGRAGFRAICLDARGHGESAWDDDGDYTLDAFRDDLAEVILSLHQPPVLIGASLGGLTALWLSGERPEIAIQSVVMVDISTRVQPKGVKRIVEFMTARPDGFDSLDAVADAIAEYLPQRKRRANLDGLRRVVRQGEDGRWRWHWDPRFIQRKWTFDIHHSDTVLKERLERSARTLTHPTLLVRGRMSDVITEEDAQAFMKLVPHCQYIDVNNAGHMVAGDNNDVFTEAVQRFLALKSE